jgi:hypothetical protein
METKCKEYQKLKHSQMNKQLNLTFCAEEDTATAQLLEAMPVLGLKKMAGTSKICSEE